MLVKLKNIILVFNNISDFEGSDESIGAREMKLYLHFFMIVITFLSRKNTSTLSFYGKFWWEIRFQYLSKNTQ